MKIQYGGKELEVKVLNLNQLSEFEEKFGSWDQYKEKMPLRCVRYIAFMAIREVFKTVTEEEVGANLTMASMPGVALLISETADYALKIPASK